VPRCSIAGEANEYRTGRKYEINRLNTDCKCASDLVLTQYLYKLLTLFKNINSADQLKWAPQARGPLCFAHAAQSIATPLPPSIPLSTLSAPLHSTSSTPGRSYALPLKIGSGAGTCLSACNILIKYKTISDL